MATSDLLVELQKEAFKPDSDGDTDCTTKHSLEFQGQEIWSFTTNMWCGIAGCGGVGSACDIRGDKLSVRVSKLRGSHSTDEDYTYALKDILISAAIKAGAEPPLKPDTFQLRIPAAMVRKASGGTTGKANVGEAAHRELAATCAE